MIYFTRHGETDYNLEKKLQGQLDIPLNAKGEDQAKVLSENIKDLNIDLIYCSSLQRAKTTAQIINKYHNVEIKYDDRLKEINGGSLQGRCFLEFPPEQKYCIFDCPDKYGGETVENFSNRTIEVLKEVFELDKNVLIVAHGGVYRSYLKNILKIENIEKLNDVLSNCEIVEIPKEWYSIIKNK